MAHLFKHAPGPRGLSAKEARLDRQIMENLTGMNPPHVFKSEVNRIKKDTKRSVSKSGKSAKTEPYKVAKTRKQRTLLVTLRYKRGSELSAAQLVSQKKKRSAESVTDEEAAHILCRLSVGIINARMPSEDENMPALTNVEAAGILCELRSRACPTQI